MWVTSTSYEVLNASVVIPQGRERYSRFQMSPHHADLPSQCSRTTSYVTWSNLASHAAITLFLVSKQSSASCDRFFQRLTCPETSTCLIGSRKKTHWFIRCCENNTPRRRNPLSSLDRDPASLGTARSPLVEQADRLATSSQICFYFSHCRAVDQVFVEGI